MKNPIKITEASYVFPTLREIPNLIAKPIGHGNRDSTVL